MTNIDKKRLASDPGYWRECGAPEGATHFCTQGGGFCSPDDIRGCDIPRPQKPDSDDQEKRILVETFVAGPGRDRIVMGGSERVMRHGDRVEIYLTRPRDPESGWVDGPKGDGVSDDTSAIQNILSPGSEAKWDGEGLPPVESDFEIDVRAAIAWHAGDAWRKCEILAHRGGKAICWVPTCNTVISTSNAEHFRSIRTKVETDRERVMINALEMVPSPVDDEVHPRQYLIDSLHALYDAGMLRKPEGD